MSCCEFVEPLEIVRLYLKMKFPVDNQNKKTPE